MRSALLAAVCVMPLAVAPAMAQEATAEMVLGQMMAMVHYQAKCKITTTPAQERTLDTVGKKMQAKAKLSDKELGDAFKQLTAELPDTDCAAFTAMWPGEVDGLKAMADSVP